MRILVLEDDKYCIGVIHWLEARNDKITLVENIEDAVYTLEYDEGVGNYDKIIFDASLPAASVIHEDGRVKDYNGALNGIDLIVENFYHWGLDKKSNVIVILTAFDKFVNEYMKGKLESENVRVISKNSDDLPKQLLDFLNA